MTTTTESPWPERLPSGFSLPKPVGPWKSMGDFRKALDHWLDALNLFVYNLDQIEDPTHSERAYTTLMQVAKNKSKDRAIRALLRALAHTLLEQDSDEDEI